MSETEVRLRQALSVLAGDGSGPPVDVAALARARARVRRRRVAVASACALVVAGLVVGAADLVRGQGGHVAETVRPRPLSLDGGALVVTRTAGHPTLGRDEAARVLAGSYLPPGAVTPQLATVAVTVPADPVGKTGPQQLSVPLAWVYLVKQPTGLVCRSSGGGFYQQPSQTVVPPTASFTSALIVDAATGTSYLYSGAGTGVCGPRASPALARVWLTFSIPFTTHDPGPPVVRQTFRIPPCGQFIGWNNGPKTFQATARVPTGPCDGTATTRSETTAGRIGTRPHAPLGLVCGGAYDAEYGRAADCVAGS